jgi:hypothetical protein
MRHIPLIMAMFAFILASGHIFSGGAADTWCGFIGYLYVSFCGGAGVMAIFGGNE